MLKFPVSRLAATAALLGAAAMPCAVHAAEVHTNDKFPFATSVFVSCANDGAGEVVDLAGELHQLVHVNVSNGGRVVIHNKSQPQNVGGTGRTTGDSYRGTGGTQETQHFGSTGDFPFVLTYVNNFRIIGAGPGNNYTVHYLIHETINGSGVVSVDFNRFSVDCK